MYSIFELSSSLNCWKDLHQNLSKEQDNVVSNDRIREFANAVFVWTRSVRWAYTSLVRKNEARLHGIDAYSADHWMYTQRIFFQRFCLLSCAAAIPSALLTPRMRCLLPLENIPEFFTAYNCADAARDVEKCPSL